MGDIVLVSLREFEMDKTADIIHKYTNDEAKSLQSYGELAGLGNVRYLKIGALNDLNELSNVNDGIEFTLQEEEIDQI